MRLKDLLKAGAQVLGGRKTAILDCEVLLAYVLGKSREELISSGGDEIDEEFSELFESYLERVKSGEPIAYITGAKEFYGLDFFVDKRVLIPRPETEQIVDRILEYLGRSENARALDVGTGSGNIAVAVAKNFVGEIEIEALEVSEGAVEVAKLNVSQHGVEDRVYVFQSDLLECVENGEKYDVIAANLPYIGEVKHHYVSKDSEKFEPNVALFGGNDGLELYRRLFSQIREKGICYGIIVGEFGFAQREDMEKVLSKYFDQEWRIEPDLAGIDRIFIIQK
ncbi:MAG: peptide chain release factor N(5)-glutamine methyltransferase [Candidatus Peregrinibacteria bacterium]